MYRTGWSDASLEAAVHGFTHRLSTNTKVSIATVVLSTTVTAADNCLRMSSLKRKNAPGIGACLPTPA